MYNLLLTSQAGGWNESPYEYDLSRVAREYTAEPISEKYSALDAAAITELMSFPALFAYEAAVGADARIGWITRIRKRGAKVRIDYKFEPTLPSIPASEIAKLDWELELNDWEMNRTHWAVKDVDLLPILIEQGLISEDHIRQQPKGSKIFELGLEKAVTEIPDGPSVPFEPSVGDHVAPVADRASADVRGKPRGSVAAAQTITIETAEEIDTASRRHFAESPAAVVAAAKQAKTIAVALLTAVDDLRLNVEEAGEVLVLLRKQIESLDKIVELLESGRDKGGLAQQTYQESLGDVLAALMQALKNQSVMRGVIAAAAFSAMGVAGVQLSIVGEGLIAGTLVGPEIVAAVGKIVKGLKNKKSE